MPLIHFLLVYDVVRQELAAPPEEYSTAADAAAAYAELERKHRNDPNVEIVLVGADSLDTIKHTHGNYFDGKQQKAGSRFLEVVG